MPPFLRVGEMPSLLRVKEKARNLTRRRSRSPSLQTRPAGQVTSRPLPQSSPSPGIQQTVANSTPPVIVLSPALQPALGAVSPPPVTKPTIANIAPLVIAPNPAFQLALAKHIENLPTKDQKAFQDGNAISMDALMNQIREFDEAHSKKSRPRRCAKKIEGFLNVLQGYLKGLTPFTSQQALGISSLVIGGVNLIIDLGLKFASFFEKLTDMMGRLGEHLEYLSKFAEGFMDSPEVQKALSHAYGDLLEFCKGARDVFTDKEGNESRWISFRIFLRVTWEPFEAVFGTINSRFREHIEIVIRTANIVDRERLHSKETLMDLQDEDKKRRDILGWLSKLEFEDDHETLFSKRYGNTGDWLLESQEFKDWLNKDDSCLLWCHGGPGVGKSVLASVVVDKISQYTLDERTGLAFVYYKHQNRAEQNSKNILSALIKQLSRKKEVLPDHLKEFHRQYSRQDELPSQMKLQAQLAKVSEEFSQVFIVIDALDECQDQDLFLPLITSLVQDSTTTIKICVTSRREKYIRDSFTKLHCPTVQIEAKKVDLDIEAFVTSEIDRRAEDYGYGVIDQELKIKIRTALLSQSSGIFLWVTYQLIYIYDQPSPQDIEEALKSLPSGMNATYNLILEKIDRQVPAMKKLAKRALMWVLYAERPLSLTELAEAVSIEQGFKSSKEMKPYRGETVVEACANLVTVEDGVVRPVHYTVQEFFTASEKHIGGPLQEYQIFPHDAHVELAQICIQYMLFWEFGSPRDTYYDNWCWETLNTHKFTRYATCFWDFHIRAVDELPHCLRDSFNIFLSTKSNLSSAYDLRTASKTSPYAINSRTQVDGFIICLYLGLLGIFKKFHQVDASIHDHTIAMHYAARGGFISSIQALLDMGFSVSTLDSDNIQPLYYACENSHDKAARFLLENGADINAQGGTYGNALQAAAFDGNEKVVELLLDKGANINAQGGHYGNALQAAASNGNEKVVELFLDKGANINAQGGHYGNALQAAASNGNEKVVELLLDKGADINAQGGPYGNALQAAAYRGNEKVVELLLDKGADINAQGGGYGNALQVAASNGNEKVVELFLDKGADINAQGGIYGNALQAAASNGNEKVVELLLDKGADINAQGGEYGNALQAAASNGNEKVVELLLDKGADINAQGGGYGNALQAAALNGNEKVVELLLDKGADINAQGGRYGNALQAAETMGRKKVVELIMGKRTTQINSQG